MQRSNATASSLASAHARIAQERMVARHRQAAEDRVRRGRNRNIQIGIAATAAVTVVLVLAVIYARMPSAPDILPRTVDPSTLHFQETRTGHIITPVRGNTCRQLSFDNRTGDFTAQKLVPCAPEDLQRPAVTPDAAPPTGDRYDAIRNSFSR